MAFNPNITSGFRPLSDEERKKREAAKMANLGITKSANNEPQAQTKLGMIKPSSDLLSSTQSEIGSITNGDNGKPYGLSITPSPDKSPISDFLKSTKPANGERLGFSAPSAPVRGYNERQERDALIKQASTAYKGSQNGQLTANQLGILAGLQNNDDKLKNEVYNAQLGFTGGLAQTQMREDAENARTALKAKDNEDQFNRQLGFDAEKLRSSTDLEQQRLGLDAQKLQGSLALGKYNADTSRINSETQQLATQKKGQLTQAQLNERIADYKNTADSIDTAINLASGMLENKSGLKGNAGLLDTYTPNFKEDTRKFNSDRKALLSQAYLANSNLLKGVLTDRDAEELKNAYGNLQDTTISDEDYAANLTVAYNLLKKMRENTDLRYQDVTPYLQQPEGERLLDADKKKKEIQKYGDMHFGGGR